MAVIVIEDWMIQERKLKGLELLAFALVHSCTQKGDGCWHGGYDRLAERIGGKTRGTIMAVNHLEEIGAIEKFDAMIDGAKKKGIRALWMGAENAYAENACAKNADAENAQETMQKMHVDHAKNAPDNKRIKSNKKTYPQEVETLYALYPSRCPKRNANTGKCYKNKEKISKLLVDHSFEELEAIFKRYISENLNQHYLYNFDTFLNRLPDYSDDSGGELFAAMPEAPKKPAPVSGFKISSGGLLDDIEY